MNWSYLDSLYYGFVSFSTVGFGDMVAASHRTDYPHDWLYRASNWLLTLLGCCCVYSLFNVTSLVIKLFLNVLIARLNVRCPATASTCLRHRVAARCCPPRLCRCCCRPPKTAATSRVVARDGVAFERRRNAIVVPGGPRARPGAPRSSRTIHPLSVADLQRRQNGGAAVLDDSSPAADSAPSSRRSSNEYVSIRDFLKVSKISMAMMQKQLYETAHHHHAAGSGPSTSTGGGGGRAPPHSGTIGRDPSTSTGAGGGRATPHSGTIGRGPSTSTGGGGGRAPPHSGTTGGGAGSSSSSGFQGGVGPLAILDHVLAPPGEYDGSIGAQGCDAVTRYRCCSAAASDR